MNRLRKNIIVHFFSLEATDDFFSDFVSSFIANKESLNKSRIFNLRQKKHLIKIDGVQEVAAVEGYTVTVVRERNTWQTKATSDGTITGITPNQGIIGDPYFFFVVPSHKVLLGFTSGPSGSLKTVGKTLLQQFCSDRSEQLKLNLIPKEKEFTTLRELPAFSSLHFKINSSSLADISEDAPQLIKNLSAAPYIENNMQLTLDFEFDENGETALSKENVVEIVNYLSEHDGCTVLKVKAVNDHGENVQLDFGDAFFNYKTEITTRHKYIDEENSIKVLNDALREYIQFSQH